MGVIIDANRAALAVQNPPDPNLSYLLNWIEKKGCLVAGGRLIEELSKIEGFRRLLIQYAQSGILENIDKKAVDEEERRLLNNPDIQSNDHHVIALARVSGARLLCTEDQALINDFLNKNVIDSPRGAVYRNKDKHAHLLRRNVQCQNCRTRNR
jgi:hypothetical protein